MISLINTKGEEVPFTDEDEFWRYVTLYEPLEVATPDERDYLLTCGLLRGTDIQVYALGDPIIESPVNWKGKSLIRIDLNQGEN